MIALAVRMIHDLPRGDLKVPNMRYFDFLLYRAMLGTPSRLTIHCFSVLQVQLA